MATKSGMNYGLMASIIESAAKVKDNVSTLLQGMSTSIPTSIAEVYSGEAAEATKASFESTAKAVDEKLVELITDLTNAANAKQEAYHSQDQKLAGHSGGAASGGSGRPGGSNTVAMQ